MTLTQLRSNLARLGFTVYRTPYGEFRINYKNGAEGSAYYTDDASDAYQTAVAMHARRLGLTLLAS